MEQDKMLIFAGLATSQLFLIGLFVLGALSHNLAAGLLGLASEGAAMFTYQFQVYAVGNDPFAKLCEKLAAAFAVLSWLLALAGFIVLL